MAITDDFLLLPQPRTISAASGRCDADAVKRVTVRQDSAIAPAQGYRLAIAVDGVSITAADAAGAFYARQTLAQLRSLHPATLPCCIIDDWPDFAARGVMLDVSRDKVPTMPTMFALVDRLASWKINQLQLYIEHTFAYSEHREVWQNASPFTADEIRALDGYCRERFIELVPNQNSFGHMERWLKHAKYRPLAEAPDGAPTPWGFFWEGPFSLCPTDPRSIELLRGMYDELLANFTSKLFNVGCDETFDIGSGCSAAAVAELGVHRVYFDFLKQVHALVSERGRRMMFWGDIIRHAPELMPAVRDELPGAIAMVWNYEAPSPFDADGAMFAAAGVPFYVCPGTSSWCTIAGRTDIMRANAWTAAIDGRRHGAIGYLTTDWGDYGHLQYLPVSYAGFAAAAAFSWCAAANEKLDLAAVLDRHAFEDRAGRLGTIATSLGNVYQAVGKIVFNGSALFRILIPSLSEKEMASGITKEGLDAADAAIDAAMTGIGEADPATPDGALVIDEFKNAAALLKLAVAIGRARSNGSPLDESARDAIIAEHQRLWLARNRPGGLDDSAARLTHLRR